MFSLSVEDKRYEIIAFPICFLFKMWLVLSIVLRSLNNLKKNDPLEIKRPKFDNSRLGLIKSVHVR